MDEGTTGTDALRTKCPICSCRRVRTDVAAARRARIEPPEAMRWCRACGLGWRWPQPPIEYERGYFEGYESWPGGTDLLPPHLAERLGAFTTLNGGAGRLLEVGVGFGTFLAAARAEGWEVSGVDVSRWTAGHVQRQHGIDVLVGDFADLPLPPASFDAAHLSHTLEHLKAPRATFARLAACLRPGGILAVEVPREFGVLYDDARRWLLGRASRPPVPSPHLFFYTPRSLAQLAEEAGFQILSLSTQRRNKDHASRFILGRYVKNLIYNLENRLGRGPNIVMIARRR